MADRRFASIELFSGAGGLALGATRAGFRHAALVEYNASACKTLRLNAGHGCQECGDWRVVEADVRDYDFSSLGQGLDLVAGGPPCQPFSLGGKHRGPTDARDMFPEAVRAVRTLRPKCFLFENVKGLLRQSFTSYFSYVLLQLTYPEVGPKAGEAWTDHLTRLERLHTGGSEPDLSYRVVFRLLNAADFGVPQHRHRVFLVGFRSDLGREWSFPAPTHSLDALLWSQYVSGTYWDEHRVATSDRAPCEERYLARVRDLIHGGQPVEPQTERYRTVRDALVGLPHPQDAGADRVPNHLFRSGARSYAGHTGSPLDEPAKAVKAGDHGVPGGENMLRLHSGGVRYLAVRESARVQTFPDDYLIYGSWTEAMRQIGNAVPAQLAHRVAETVARQLAAT
ncbi:MAG: DNA cytosine methyltransferase [Armatimonadetes bacterium]|nr:DNA cytosine methyltransferase [Armatimonadota bacterium]